MLPTKDFFLLSCSERRVSKMYIRVKRKKSLEFVCRLNHFLFFYDTELNF